MSEFESDSAPSPAPLPPSVPSPCVAICTLDPDTGLCKGCYRTLAEIGGWFNYGVERKLEVVAAIGERRRKLGATTLEEAREKARAERRAERRRVSSRHPPGAGTNPSSGRT
jgi:hypothetical protein